MSLFKKDTIPMNQVEEAWEEGQNAFASFPFGLEVLQAGKEASETLFRTIKDHQLDGHETSGSTSDRQEIEDRLYTVFSNAVSSVRTLGFNLTHDQLGRLTDPKAWTRYAGLTDVLLPPGGRSQIARSGKDLIKQCRFFCEAAKDALPGSDVLVAPVEAILAEYAGGLGTFKQVQGERASSAALLEQRRADLLRLRRAGYYLMKCMENWDPDFPLDADKIYIAQRTAASKKAASPSKATQTEASGGAPPVSSTPDMSPGAPPPSPEGDDAEPDDDPVSLAELEALHAALHNERPVGPDRP